MDLTLKLTMASFQALVMSQQSGHPLPVRPHWIWVLPTLQEWTSIPHPMNPPLRIHYLQLTLQPTPLTMILLPWCDSGFHLCTIIDLWWILSSLLAPGVAQNPSFVPEVDWDPVALPLTPQSVGHMDMHPPDSTAVSLSTEEPTYMPNCHVLSWSGTTTP